MLITITTHSITRTTTGLVAYELWHPPVYQNLSFGHTPLILIWMFIFTGISEIHNTLQESRWCHRRSAGIGTWTPRISGASNFFLNKFKRKPPLHTSALTPERSVVTSKATQPHRDPTSTLWCAHRYLFRTWGARLVRPRLDSSSALLSVYRAPKNHREQIKATHDGVIHVMITQCCVRSVRFSRRMTTNKYPRGARWRNPQSAQFCIVDQHCTF